MLHDKAVKILLIESIKKNIFVFWKKVTYQTVATIMLHQALCGKVQWIDKKNSDLQKSDISSFFTNTKFDNCLSIRLYLFL